MPYHDKEQHYTNQQPPDPTQPQGGYTPGAWETTTDYGTEDWKPSYAELVGWVEGGRFDTGDLAKGFGLEESAGKFFPEADWWQNPYLEKEYGIAEDKRDLAKEKAERLQEEGWQSFDTAVESGLFGADTSMYETMEASRARQVQSQFAGAGRGAGRQRRQAVDKYLGGLDVAQDTAKSIEAQAGESIAAADIAYAQAEIDRDQGVETVKRAWYDDVWDAYAGMEARGGIEQTSGGKNAAYWIGKIRDEEDHWSVDELNAYNTEPEFLQWFAGNIGKMDSYRDIFQGS